MGEDDFLTRSSVDAETPESLESLSGEIRKILVPVQPGRGFRDGLRDQLAAAVSQRMAWKVILLSEDHRWAFILGAGLIFLIPLLGAVGYLLCSRLMGRPLNHTSGNPQSAGLR